MNRQIHKIKDGIQQKINEIVWDESKGCWITKNDADSMDTSVETDDSINSPSVEPEQNKEHISDDLEEAAKIAKREFIARFNWSGNQETGFSEGAKWMKEQMMKDVTTATCCGANAFQSVWYFDDLKSDDVAAGDKIKVIIIKEEE